MLTEVFTAVGLPYTETAFLSPPAGAYIAYGTKIDAFGSDDDNEVRRITVTAELVEPADCPNPEAHVLLQETLDDAAIRWRKDDRIYYEDLRLFFTIYTFEYLEIRR